MAPARRIAFAAAIALAAVWSAAVFVVPVSISQHTVGFVNLVDLREHRSNALCHFILIDGVAPILLWTTLVPAIRRLSSVDARFTAALSGVSACVVSVIQLGLGIWLTVGRDDRPIAEFAGVRTLHELTGVKAALAAVALISLATPWSVSRIVRTRLDLRLAATSAALAVTALGYFTGDATLTGVGWIAVPLLLIETLALATSSHPTPQPFSFGASRHSDRRT